MQRSILTGFFAFTLTLCSWSVALAGDPSLPNSDQAASAAQQTAGSGTTQAVATTGSSDSETASAALPVTATLSIPAYTSAALPITASQPAALVPTPGYLRPVSRLRRFAGSIASRTSAIASRLTRSAMRFIGVPYVFGGTRATGFDCSGYVQHVFGLHGLHLPRTADAQFDAARRIRTPLVAGDLVFFHTYAPGVSHVGIYLGHNRFIHASSSRGVAVSSLHDRYWAPRYLGAKRVVGS